MVTLSGGTSYTGVTVDLAYSGTASTGDYSLSTGTNAVDTDTIVIPAGSVSGYIAVTAVQDTLDEPDETVTASIVSVINALTGNSNEATMILDDDILYLELSLDTGNVAESGGVATLIGTLSGGTSVNTITATFSFA